MELLLLIIHHGVDLNAQTKEEGAVRLLSSRPPHAPSPPISLLQTALSWASIRGHTRILHHLAKWGARLFFNVPHLILPHTKSDLVPGADLNLRDKRGLHCLHHAAMARNFLSYIRSALLTFTQHNQMHVLHYLVEVCQVDLNIKDIDGHTPLMCTRFSL